MRSVIPTDARGRLVTMERLTANRDINEKNTPGVYQLADLIAQASQTSDGLGVVIGRITSITPAQTNDYIAGAQRTINASVNGVAGSPTLLRVPCLSTYTPYIADSVMLLKLAGDQGYVAIGSTHACNFENAVTGGGTSTLRATVTNPNMGSNGFDYSRVTMLGNGLGFVQIRWQFGTSGSGAAGGGGTYYFSAPLGISTAPLNLMIPYCGGGYYYDSSTNIVWNLQVRQQSNGLGGNGLFLYVDNHVAAGYQVTTTNPFAVSFGDEFGIYALVEYA